MTVSSFKSAASLRGRIGAYALHAQYGPGAVSEPGRRAADQALNERLLAEIDPKGRLSESERDVRLVYARKRHFSQLRLRRANEAAKKAGGPGAKK